MLLYQITLNIICCVFSDYEIHSKHNKDIFRASKFVIIDEKMQINGYKAISFLRRLRDLYLQSVFMNIPENSTHVTVFNSIANMFIEDRMEQFRKRILPLT